MIADRRARGFERVGTAGAAALGLAPVRARQLAVEAAWRRVAGRSLAERATVVDLSRGILSLRVADPTWRRAIDRLLPELSARFAREHGALGVVRFRIV
ncbi:MAG TPA: DciA family protein [Candidatus Polarisedimenticolaceae bacterium]|nr:DciA family protein [Candidatus Polarisedimenticolaceae bacterium]